MDVWVAVVDCCLKLALHLICGVDLSGVVEKFDAGETLAGFDSDGGRVSDVLFVPQVLDFFWWERGCKSGDDRFSAAQRKGFVSKPA
ncbi:MAG: hypothetical protein ACLQVL_02395 [Terriglobia bacterium]